MSKVFRVDFDVSCYQFFIPNENDIKLSGLLGMGCESMAGKWNPPRLRWQRYDRKRRLIPGDFQYVSAGTIIAGPHTLQKVLPFFEAAGEILPLPFEGVMYSLLHVTRCIECLNTESSEWLLTPEGTRALLQKYSFNPERFGASSIFKVPEQPRGVMLTFEQTGAPSQEFKAFVEAQGLTGLKFNLVWSDE